MMRAVSKPVPSTQITMPCTGPHVALFNTLFKSISCPKLSTPGGLETPRCGLCTCSIGSPADSHGSTSCDKASFLTLLWTRCTSRLPAGHPAPVNVRFTAGCCIADAVHACIKFWQKQSLCDTSRCLRSRRRRYWCTSGQSGMRMLPTIHHVYMCAPCRAPTNVIQQSSIMFKCQ